MVSTVDKLPSLSHEGRDRIESRGHVSTNRVIDNIESAKSGNMCDSGPQSNIECITNEPTTTPRSLDLRLPAVKSSSVFDRLYKSHTAASKRHTLSSRAMLKPSTPKTHLL